MGKTGMKMECEIISSQLQHILLLEEDKYRLKIYLEPIVLETAVFNTHVGTFHLALRKTKIN